MSCGIWYHLYNLKNVKNTHEGVLLLACNFTKSNTPPWVFFTFFKLYKWYQITQRITIRKISNLGGDTQVPSLPSRIKSFGNISQKLRKRRFQSC